MKEMVKRYIQQLVLCLECLFSIMRNIIEKKLNKNTIIVIFVFICSLEHRILLELLQQETKKVLKGNYR